MAKGYAWDSAEFVRVYLEEYAKPDGSLQSVADRLGISKNGVRNRAYVLRREYQKAIPRFDKHPSRHDQKNRIQEGLSEVDKLLAEFEEKQQ